MPECKNVELPIKSVSNLTVAIWGEWSNLKPWLTNHYYNGCDGFVTWILASICPSPWVTLVISAGKRRKLLNLKGYSGGLMDS